jgi:hypothetical protein
MKLGKALATGYAEDAYGALDGFSHEHPEYPEYAQHPEQEEYAEMVPEPATVAAEAEAAEPRQVVGAAAR